MLEGDLKRLEKESARQTKGSTGMWNKTQTQKTIVGREIEREQ